MKLFVTGAAGFIGSNFVRHVLATSDDSVTVYDALTYAGNLANLADVADDPRYAFVHAGGCVVEKQLQAGETLRLDTGCLVAMTPSVNYDIQLVGGVKNTLFGGEGLFLATLTGPGHVWCQSLPFSRLAGRMLASSLGGGNGHIDLYEVAGGYADTEDGGISLGILAGLVVLVVRWLASSEHSPFRHAPGAGDYGDAARLIQNVLPARTSQPNYSVQSFRLTLRKPCPARAGGTSRASKLEAARQGATPVRR